KPEVRIVGGRVKQQGLRLPSPTPPTLQPGRKDARLVENQDITGRDEIDQVREDAVLKGPGLPIDYQQPALVAPLCRRLRDELFRQLIVEIVGLPVSLLFHVCSAPAAYASKNDACPPSPDRASTGGV